MCYSSSHLLCPCHLILQTIANNIISYYRSFGSCEDKKKVFLSILANNLGVSRDDVVTKAQHLVDLHANVSYRMFVFTR